MDDWLDHNSDLIEMFEGDKTMLHELNATASRVRSAMNSLLDEIEERKRKIDELEMKSE